MNQIELSLHSKIAPLENRSRHQFIWPTRLYECIQNATVVPTTIFEFRLVACYMPTAFVRIEGEIQSIALLGLPGFQNLLSGPKEPPALPLRLRAFPLALGAKRDDDHTAIWINEPPREPSGPGIPAFGDDGSMSPALTEKSDALWLYAKSREQALPILKELEELDAFEPWPLEMVFHNGALAVSDLLRVRLEFLQSEKYLAMVEKHGFEAASALQYHRISLTALKAFEDLDQLTVAASPP